LPGEHLLLKYSELMATSLKKFDYIMDVIHYLKWNRNDDEMLFHGNIC